MKDRKKIKVCMKCNKLYEKCYCAYPAKHYIGMKELAEILTLEEINNGKIL